MSRTAPPRLLMLTSNAPRWPGDSTTPFVLNLAADLQELGWRVDVLAPHAAGAKREEVLGGLRITRFRYNIPARAQTLAYGGGALINARASRWAAAQIPLFVGGEWAALHRSLRAGRYDALQSHWVLPQGAVASWAAPRAGVPHLATIHGSDVLGLDSRLMSAFKRRALTAANAVSVNSSATERAVRKLAPTQAAVHRIPMGITIPAQVSEEERAGKRSQWRRGNGPLIAYVGRLVGWKGVDDLVAAIDLLQQQLPDVTCVIAGTGQEKARLREDVAARSLRESVRFLGWVHPSDVPGVFAAADVIVCPSRLEADGTTEGQGLAVLEGMASGVPVVATRVGGIPDSLRDGTDGLLVPDQSPQELADAITRLHQDPAWGARLGASAQARAREFSRPASAAHFDAVLRDLVSRRAIAQSNRPAGPPPQ